MNTESKKRDVQKRIERLEQDIEIANKYLETGEHAHWHKFKPLFKEKMLRGSVAPPHKDWVSNVFIPNLERKLSEAERIMDGFD